LFFPAATEEDETVSDAANFAEDLKRLATMNGWRKYLAVTMLMGLPFGAGYGASVLAQTVDVAVLQSRVARAEQDHQAFVTKESINPQLEAIREELRRLNDKLDRMIERRR
jgi:hypothetical protein